MAKQPGDYVVALWTGQDSPRDGDQIRLRETMKTPEAVPIGEPTFYAENPTYVLLKKEPSIRQVNAATILESSNDAEKLNTLVSQRNAARESSSLENAEFSESMKNLGEQERIRQQKTDEMVSELLSDWKEAGIDNPREHLILSDSNARVAELNSKCQELMRERFEENSKVNESLDLDDCKIQANDRIVITREHEYLASKPGSFGTVSEVTEALDMAHVRWDDGEISPVLAPDFEESGAQPAFAMSLEKMRELNIDPPANTYVFQERDVDPAKVNYERFLSKDKPGVCNVYLPEKDQKMTIGPHPDALQNAEVNSAPKQQAEQELDESRELSR